MKLIALMTLVTLAGCATPDTVYVPQEVKVLVPVQCSRADLGLGDPPEDTLLALPLNASPAQKQAAALTDLESYRSWSNTLWIALGRCSK